MGMKYLGHKNNINNIISSARLLLNELGKKISAISGEAREASFLFQRASVLVQRFNAVLLRNSLPAADCMD